MADESGNTQGKTYEVGKGKPPKDTQFGGKHAKEIDYRFDKGKFAKGLHEDTQS